MSCKTVWEKESFDYNAADTFCDKYKKFISDNKTERECVNSFIDVLQDMGALSLDDLTVCEKTPSDNAIIYKDMMGKALLVFKKGKRPVADGLRILGAHIDSPRLDLKQRPLFENQGLTLLDTHYYGGIKKYQWVALPLSLHGIVAKKNGEIINISIGEKESDPVLGVSDLLPHLGRKQLEKTGNEIVAGEALDLLVGSRPSLAEKEDKSDKKEQVKETVLSILKKEYGIEEEDFVSAEIEVVPAGNARDYGIDRSMVMGYGQDDRVCAYASFEAFIDEKEAGYSTICLLTDKEEIGSVGATGMQSRFFEDTVAEILNLYGDYSEIALRRTLRKSKVLSSDVSAAFDPLYPEVMEKNNCAYLGYGPVFNKYTGARGKSGSNDANAEYIAFLRNVMDNAGIVYQTAELGKVDEGGGGTIAYMLANLGMEVIDFGVAVLNMHAPFEITSKADIYETYLAYKAFLKA